MNIRSSFNRLVLLLLSVMLMSISANATDKLSDMTKHGEGIMKVMFWDVYKAELFSNQPQFDIKQYPQALKITYLRDIKRQALLEATEDQWQHLAVPIKLQQRWLDQLDTIWPDIAEGDSITAVINQSRKSYFYLSKNQQTTFLGSIDESEFGELFLAIWLSEQTSRPELRRQLITNTRN